MVLCDLVGVLAGSRHFDASAPVRVHVAERVSHVLQALLADVLRLVQTHVEVSGSHATLRRLLRHQEEVEASVVLLVLNQRRVDDAAWRWVLHSSAVSALDEHPLVDPLVHNNQSDWWDSRQLVVEGLQDLLELLDFLFNDLVSHTFSNSISVDDDLRGKVSLVLF